MFSSKFQRNVYSVTVAEQGGEAIEKLNANHFDVAMVDLGLSEMEASRLFPIIKKHPLTHLR